MVITNRKNLPSPFVSMVSAEYVVAEDEYRVTSLLKGVREAILERRHRDEIEQDVSDMIWLLFGTAVHGILEQHQEGGSEIKESRIKIDFDGYVLSGQFDLYNDDEGKVIDYKTASVWKIMYGEYDDWRRQLLIYCYMLRRIGFNARRGEIVAMLKDHSKRDAKHKPDYPQVPVEVIHFDFKDSDFIECEEWLSRRFMEIRAAERLPDDRLPLCTPDERYNSGDRFAVIKKGRKTALRVLDDEGDAIVWMGENGGDSIEVRRGEDKKCKDYCAVCDFCNYYKEHVKHEQS